MGEILGKNTRFFVGSHHDEVPENPVFSVHCVAFTDRVSNSLRPKSTR